MTRRLNALQRRRDDIVRVWETLARAEPGWGARDLWLRETVAPLLDDLAAWAAGDGPPAQAGRGGEALAGVVQRVEGPELAQVLREVTLLRQAILDEVLAPGSGRDGALPPARVAEVLRLEAGLDATVAGALERFVRARERGVTAAQAEVRDNEARLRALVEPWAQAYWETDAEGLVVADSPSWRAYTGQTYAEWIGFGWVDAIHPEDRDYAERLWRECVAGRRPVDAEFRLRSASGGWRWTNVRASPVLAANGRVLKWVGINVDITERKAIDEHRALLVAIGEDLGRLASADEIVRAVGARVGPHLGASRVSFAELAPGGAAVEVRRGWSASGARPARSRVPLAELDAALLRAHRAGELAVVEDAQADPRVDHARCAAAGVRAFVSAPYQSGGAWRGFLAVEDARAREWREDELDLVRNLAELVFPRLERARVEEELRKANQQKADFLAVLSHELRNPLAPIRSSLYVMEHAPAASAQAARAREALSRQTLHLTRLVDDLLDMTRISRGKIALQRTRIDLRDVVQRTADDLGPTFAERGVALRVDGGPGPAWVVGDADRLAQVLSNLLHNSAKFTPPGGSVTVTLASAGGDLTLSVRDTGEGMDPAQIERMFEPFAQATQSLARTRGGLGLGLALVRGFVELHGGRVRASSGGLGRGSEVVVTLPLAGAAARDAGPSGAAAPLAPGRDLVVIEDNVDAAQTLSDVLALQGHRVRVAHDGATGLALVRERRPDLVLCDIGLPDVSGYEIASALRADPAFRETRLVALTGYAQPEDRERASRAGFDAHLAKPLDFAQLARLLGGGPGPAGGAPGEGGGPSA